MLVGGLHWGRACEKRVSFARPNPEFGAKLAIIGMDSIFIFLDRICRIDGLFFAYGETPFGRRPLYPVNPVQLLFKDKNPLLFFCRPSSLMETLR